jgi:hypothetical protein
MVKDCAEILPWVAVFFREDALSFRSTFWSLSRRLLFGLKLLLPENFDFFAIVVAPGFSASTKGHL